MSDKIWSDGLTGEQHETVERAARAMWDGEPSQFRWDELTHSSREHRCRSALAVLRVINVIPPPKVPSRGEAVAEKVVNLCMGHLRFMYPDGTGQIMEMRNPDDCLRWTRQAVAAHINAEIAAALDLAAKLVTDDYGSRVELAKSILALKGAAHV